jgi:hypothetical protein
MEAIENQLVQTSNAGNPIARPLPDHEIVYLDTLELAHHLRRRFPYTPRRRAGAAADAPSGARRGGAPGLRTRARPVASASLSRGTDGGLPLTAPPPRPRRPRAARTPRAGPVDPYGPLEVPVFVFNMDRRGGARGAGRRKRRAEGASRTAASHSSCAPCPARKA